MIKKIVLACLLFAAFKSYSQEEGKAESVRLMNLYQKLEGTYQIEIFNSRELPTVQLALMDQIESKRDNSAVTYIWLKDNVRVKILPKSQIGAADFKRVEKTVYISQ